MPGQGTYAPGDLTNLGIPMTTEVIPIERQRRVFKQGAVFMTFWVAPRGYPWGSKFSMYEMPTLETHGEFQRFIVYRNKRDHSICVPIRTYRGRGTTSPNVQAKEHAIAYTTPHPPEPLEGENANTLLAPIKIIPKANEDYSLLPASRINFGRTYCFEHNVPIAVFGKVDDNDLGQFTQFVKRFLID